MQKQTEGSVALRVGESSHQLQQEQPQAPALHSTAECNALNARKTTAFTSQNAQPAHRTKQHSLLRIDPRRVLRTKAQDNKLQRAESTPVPQHQLIRGQNSNRAL